MGVEDEDSQWETAPMGCDFNRSPGDAPGDAFLPWSPRARCVFLGGASASISPRRFEIPIGWIPE